MKKFTAVLIVLIFQAALCCVASAQELVEELWLTFDEVEGDVVKDITGNEHDGKLMDFKGEPLVDSELGFGKALVFPKDSEAERVVVPYFDAFATDTFTIETWIYFTKLPEDVIENADDIIHIFDHESPDGWSLVVGDVGLEGISILWLVQNPGGWVNCNGRTLLQTNKWYNIAGVCDNGTLTVYLDGEEEGSAKYQPPRITNKTDLWLGGYQQRPPERGFRGIMDDVQFSAVAKRQKQLAYSRWENVSPKAKLTTCWARLKFDGGI